MMAVLTFVFTKIFPSSIPNFPVFVLCGIVPFSFFTVAWGSATGSIVDSAGLIKKMQVPRESFPIASVLSTCLHLGIQIALLLAIALASGIRITDKWLWLPVLWLLELIFTCGAALASSGLNVYIRDTRYVVDSINTVLFWMVPIFYPFSVIPARFAEMYQYNPIAALVLGMRQVILENSAPSSTLLYKAVLVSFVSLGIGLLVFERLKDRFYDHL